ncbi:MAG: CoA transferase, partial [Thermodesulfobacteriota bacterium]
GVPAKLSRTPGKVKSAAPLLGQHTEEVLQGILGRTPAEIQRLRDQGVI